MKWLGDNPFHTLLVLTEKPGEWATWKLAPVPVAVASGAGLVGSQASGDPASGWIIAAILLGSAAADYCLLAALPRRGLSHGPVQPPWLGLVFLRGLIAMFAALGLARWPVPTIVVLAFIQAAIWAITLYGTAFEPFRIEITRLEVASPKLAIDDRPLRLVQLSDLHVERLTRREHSLPDLVASLAPDAILLTGDFLNTSYQSDPRALSDLQSLLGKLRAPGGVYAVWGTGHVDLPDFLRPALADLGVTLLEDQAVELSAGKQKVWLMGLTCPSELEAAHEELCQLMTGAPAESFVVLLYHTPDLMPAASALGVDLVLSGHTHGGQWRIPGFGAVLTSSRFWKRYEAGLYREGSTQLYVSRGLGMEGFGTPRARFFCPPEIVSIHLTGTMEGP